MSEFKVGEVAIVANVVNQILSCYIGTEVTIVGELRPASRLSRLEGQMVHDIRTVDGVSAIARPCDLRKKRPPQETTDWQAIASITGWHPAGVPA